MIGYCLFYRYRKCRALSVYAVYRYGSIHQFDQLLYDTESQTGSLYMPVLFFINPLKCIKKIGQCLFFYSHSRICDRDHKLTCVLIHILALHTQFHSPLLCIFNCVVQKIYDYLLDTDLIPIQDHGNLGVYTYFKRKTLIICPKPHHIYDLGQHIPNTIINGNNIHTSGFYL